MGDDRNAAMVTWTDSNQQMLQRELDRVRALLERVTDSVQNDIPDGTGSSIDHLDPERAGFGSVHPSALDRLSNALRMTQFERDLLILCAGNELDSKFASLLARASGDPLVTYPTFSLALAHLPSAHWSALSAEAPLRKWRMIEIGSGQALTRSPLRIDETVLHYLAGVYQVDERLSSFIESVVAPDRMVPSLQMIATRAADSWRDRDGDLLPVIHFQGNEFQKVRDIAAAACENLGLALYVLPAAAIPVNPTERKSLMRLLERESILGGSALLLNCTDVEPTNADRVTAVGRLIERLDAPLFVFSNRLVLDFERYTLALQIPKATREEQRSALELVLGDSAPRLNGHVERLVNQFELEAQALSAAKSVVAGAHDRLSDEALSDQIWDAVRISRRHALDELAQRVEPAATWDDLILPDAQKQILRDIAVHVRQRSTVYDSWGFASKGSRGLGISALFAGASGTGKTMASEVLANELRLDLYRIDLSSVVSKYIGETEKNLRRVFDAAEGGGTILLFDEADALFGKRSEVKDSHDRYANIEVSYLLQRMEAYRGLAILTTNLKNALDTAFLRRIRFIVQFPFPDAEQRARIWERVFPAQTPTQDLDIDKLARLIVAGGTIRNIALNAAFLAADEGDAVRMRHLLRAARSEYTKLEKPLTEAESGGWL